MNALEAAVEITKAWIQAQGKAVTGLDVALTFDTIYDAVKKKLGEH